MAALSEGQLWWGSNGFDTVSFNSFGIPTGRNGGTTLEGGGGVTGKLTRNVSVYGDASYLTSVSGESHIALNPHSPDDALSFGTACAIQIYDQHVISDRARRSWRTRRVNRNRMLFGSISTAA